MKTSTAGITATILSTSAVTGAGGSNSGIVNTANYSTYPYASNTSTLTLKNNDADIMIGDKSMKAWMEKVEQRLSILEPKPELLAKYTSLQQAYEHYKTLENLLYGAEDGNN